jgi:hypothetical protein
MLGTNRRNKSNAVKPWDMYLYDICQHEGWEMSRHRLLIRVPNLVEAAAEGPLAIVAVSAIITALLYTLTVVCL